MQVTNKFSWQMSFLTVIVIVLEHFCVLCLLLDAVLNVVATICYKCGSLQWLC